VNWREMSWHTVSTVSAVEAWLTGTGVELSERNAATTVSTRTPRTHVSVTVVNVRSVDRILSQLQQSLTNLHLRQMSTSACRINGAWLYRTGQLK